MLTMSYPTNIYECLVLVILGLLVESFLVPLARVNLLSNDDRVLRAFLHAYSRALGRALVFNHVVSTAHRVADRSG